LKLRLRVKLSPTDSFEFNHEGSDLLIGRSAEADLRLQADTGQYVSVRHALISQLDRSVFIADQGSRNGTFLNGKRVQAPAAIRDGDEIWLGQAGPRVEVVSAVWTDFAAQRLLPEPAASACEKGVAAEWISALTNWTLSNPRIAIFAMAVLFVAGAGVGFLKNFTKQSAQVQAQPTAVAASADPLAESVPNKNQSPENPIAFKPAKGDELKTQPQVNASESLVLLGVEVHTDDVHRFLVYTGWLSDASTVVTTGQNVHDLILQCAGQKVKIFAVTHERPDDVIYVDKLIVHPDFSADAASSVKTIHNNVGLAVLSRPFPASVRPLPVTEEGIILRNNVPITVVGLAIAPDPQDQRFDALNVPKVIERTGVVRGPDVADASIRVPRRLIDIPFTHGFDGAPALDANGRIVAMICQRQNDEMVFGIPLQVIREVLASH
jgi:hypothetical protein